MTLKPFVINQTDLTFLLQQVTFQPLFDLSGNAMVNWNGTDPVVDRTGAIIDLTGLSAAEAIALYGIGFPSAVAPVGVRDVTGYHNNLFGTQADWGTVDQIFRRDIAADFDNYVKNPLATATVSIDPDTFALTINYADPLKIDVVIAQSVYAPLVDITTIKQITLNAAATSVTFTQDNGVKLPTINLMAVLNFAAAMTGEVAAPNFVTSVSADGSVISQANVVDATPRMITRTITTADVNLLKDAAGHYVEWRADQYASDPVYKALIDGSGVNIAQLVEGAKIVAPAGLALVWDPTADSASIVYKSLLTFIAGTGTLHGDNAGGPLVDGGSIYKLDGGVYTLLSGLTFNANLCLYHSLVVESGVDTGSLAPGDMIDVTVADIVDAIASLATLGPVSAETANGLLESGSGYGLLEALGHIDFQNPDSGEYFIGSENPGVAPSNSWFAIFGQFFDHGLDKIGNGGQGTTVKIALDPSDPLFGVIGPDGRPATSITISRSTVAGQDANGDPNYVNHTSPFIDQSQTYGSTKQITDLLRKWVSTDGGLTYHAGMELLDGVTLVDSWTRKWPDGTTTEVHDTLPSVSELRDHVLDTDRDALTWEDFFDYRNRDAAGNVSTGNSGQNLLMDMNPRFDSAHLDSMHAVGTTTVDALVDAAVATLAASTGSADLVFGRSPSGSIQLIVTNGAGGPFMPNGTYTGASALALWVNFADFSITAPAGAVHDAVGEILLASVGDHYIAGDGRVNENFGLTAIHHVFHEEHNFQVANLIKWINQIDAANSPDTHEQLNNWQINTGVTDLAGNFVHADGVTIAWDPDKMFEATKLIVEMEYQHAAVDQYARSITPRIQEFVGYSSDVDATITLEFSQSAFRFGHSTIRETIDTLDPDGWFFGAVTKYALEKAFLTPQTFAEEGVAAITLGLARQQMNEVDEFITPALNQGLLGMPLDLAAINIARGRDLGIPTLNDFREGLGLARYTSWTDFGANMIHPESLVNFIAAYSFNGNVAMAAEIMGLADGSITGPGALSGLSASEAMSFMNNDSTTALLGQDGFNHIDTWLGGLAEAHVPGGLLGETFDAVFVAQIVSLMDGDRFYYLFRLFGTQIHEEVNNGQFKDIVERNTGLEHLNGSIFAYADKYYDVNRDADLATAGIQDNYAEHAYANLLAANPTLGVYTDGGNSTANNGTIVNVGGQQYILDIRPELNANQVHTVEGTPTSGADSHEVYVGTDNNDFFHMRAGDDTAYGEGGDDIMYGDGGIDRLYGGDGNDYIDAGEGPDLVDGGAGKDTIYGRGSGSEVGGFDQLVGGSGNDTIYGGEGIDKLSGGAGDDVIYGDELNPLLGGNTDPFTHGGDGNDFIDGGVSGDNLYGEDLIFGGTGDDIIRPGTMAAAIGMGPDEVIGDDGFTNTGFDLIDFSDWALSSTGVVADMLTQTNPLVAVDNTTPFPAWFQMEGVIGSRNNDTLIGVGSGVAIDQGIGMENWLIGGSGSDIITGGGGDDLIVGGSIRLDSLIGTYTGQAGYLDNAESLITGASNRATGALTNGLLDAAGLGHLEHFQEMLRSAMFKDLVLGDNGSDSLSTDKALFTGNFADYTITEISFTPAGSTTPITAYKVVDNVADRDGTDIVVGVEFFQFADQTVNSADHAPTGALSIIDYQLRGGLRQNSVVRLQAQSTIDDADGHANVSNTWQRQNADGTWSNFGVAGSFVLRINAAGTYRFTETYTDSFGVKTVVSGQIAIVGAATAQVMDGTAGQDIMLGMGGADTLNGSAGNDIMDGGAGVDTASFAAMAQSVTVNLGANAPATTLTDAGAGTATGAEIGSDLLVSIANVTGGAGGDILTGNSGANILDGGAGNDTMNGAAGNDTLTGGLGNDIIVGGTGNNDTAIFGKSVFAFNFSTTGSLIVADTDVAPATNLGTDTLSGIELLQFTEGTYNLVLGTNVGETRTGNGLNDLILGFDGADTLNGNGGADILIGGLGADVMNGGDGNDIFVVDDAGDTISQAVGAGGGTDLVRSSVTRTLEANVENLTLTGTAAINGTGNAGANIIIGNDAANLLSGAGGNDTLTGGLGNDTLVGGTHTGAGDIAVFGKSVMSFAFGGTATALTVDDIDTNAATDLGTDTLSTIERVQFAEGIFVLNTAGTGGGDTITTTVASDLLLGFDGDDILDGAGGADIIDGGIGKDTITGGEGRDIMTGGAGDDTFVFATGNSGNAAATRDIVTDFALDDRIDLFGWDANGVGGAGNGDFASQFVDDFTVAGELRYYLDANGNTIVEGNTDSDAASEFQIQLNGAFELKHVVSGTEDYLILA
jgi:Ca2+-binding RTX toxin-like protein